MSKRLSEDQADGWLVDAQRVLHEMPVALLATDRMGVVTFANSRACRTFGYGGDDMVGLDIEQLLPNTAAQSSPATARSDNEGRRQDGTNFPVRLYTKNVGAKGRPSYLIAVEDLTKEREVEQLKHQFLAMISHELRSPLTAVSSAVQLVTDGICGELPKEAATKLDTIVPILHTVNKLIADLLQVEKLSSGTFKLGVEPISIKTFMEPAMLAVVDKAERRGVTLKFDTAAHNDTKVMADVDRMVQVLINLLSNAIKYSPDGSTVLTQCRSGKKFLRISVIDTGTGVPLELRSAIFEPFKQADAYKDTKSGGTGLGLAICKAIVEQHGGSIGVEPTEGQGSEFWFTVPLAR